MSRADRSLEPWRATSLLPAETLVSLASTVRMTCTSSTTGAAEATVARRVMMEMMENCILFGGVEGFFACEKGWTGLDDDAWW